MGDTIKVSTTRRNTAAIAFFVKIDDANIVDGVLVSLSKYPEYSAVVYFLLPRNVIKQLGKCKQAEKQLESNALGLQFGANAGYNSYNDTCERPTLRMLFNFDGDRIFAREAFWHQLLPVHR